MKQNSRNKIWGRMFSWVLAAALLFSNAEPAAMVQAQEGTAISIGTAEDLAKIGTDSNYPMTGDYVLTEDIDLSGVSWTPMGGYIGNKGSCNPSEPNVFSGTFVGQGHVISGLTIQLDGSINQEGKYGQVGLFSVIGSDNSSDYAEVKNLIFTNVDVHTDFTDGLAAIGTLAGEVNGYANVSSIVVLNGELNINRSELCDTVGAGGIIGECRTSADMGNGNISIKDCYNGANVLASGSRSDLIYTGGILGRVAKTACKEISQCVNVGMVQYQGYDAFAIAAAEGANSELLSSIADCYYSVEMQQLPSGTATEVSDKELKSGVLPGNLSGDHWSAQAGCYPVPAFCFQSNAAGLIYLSGLSLGFAEGEEASGVRTEIVLPQSAGGQALTWTSSQEHALSIQGDRAIAHSAEIGSNTTVTLTAQTSKGEQRSFKIIVLTDREQKATFDQGYPKVGEPFTVSVSNTEGIELSYQWSVNGTPVSNDAASYTPSADDLEKFISVVVTAQKEGMRWELSAYCSQLPVIYVDTNDGQEINSNTVAKDAFIKVQGNQEFNNQDTWYEGATTIKGRGNSTWSYAQQNRLKKPYKLKLDSKANLLGLGRGSNKHWVLLANVIDHTNMRNELVHDFTKKIGMETTIGDTGVILILNGEYQGVYELSEHVRVGGARVDVFEWEELADDIAKAVCKKETALKKSDLETFLEENFSWMSGSFQYQGKTYQVADYYTDPIPDFTGGFLLDMDRRSANDQYKYISTFQTSNGVPMFFRAPEYAKTNPKMVEYARNYLNAYESALASPDFTTNYQGKNVHYTDLFDMDSLLQYWLICEFTNNWDSMKNSSYLYKDLEGKAKMGPAWDYDWAWGNINMYNMTGPFVYDQWHTTLSGISMSAGGFAEEDYQKRQWQRFLVKDPYFVTRAYELYHKYHSSAFEEMIKSGGTIDTLLEKYRKASEVNDNKWSYSYGLYWGKAFVNGLEVSTASQNYQAAVNSMKTFIEKRLDWMDRQFTDVNTLYASLGNTVSDDITVTASGFAEDGTLTATAEIASPDVKYVTFLVNGRKLASGGSERIPVVNGMAAATVDGDMMLTNQLNTIEALAVDSSGAYIKNKINFTTFDGPQVKLEGTVVVQSDRQGEISYPGDTLKAEVTDTNNSGTLHYQWFADNTAIAGATETTYVLRATEIGKQLSVKVSSSKETGTLKGVYAGTVKNKQQPVKVKNIKLSAKSKKMYAYQTLQLKATVTPAAASKNIAYVSSKKSVATVSKTGKITAKSPGTAKITVKATDGSNVKAVCNITVRKPVIKVSGKMSVKLKKSLTLTAKTYGLKGKVTWKLDAKGKKLLKLKKAGTNKIKLTAGKKTGKAKLTVTCGKKKVTKVIQVKK